MTRRAMLATGAIVAALCCAACSPTMMPSAPTLMSGTQAARGSRGSTDTFRLDDRIIQLVDFTWSDPGGPAGVHDCEWKWFRDGRLVSDTPERRIFFSRTPFTLRTMRPAPPLGVGHYTVQTIVDDQVVATSASTITG